MKFAVLVVVAALAVAALAYAPVDDVIENALKNKQNLNILVHFPARKSADDALLQKMTRLERQRMIFNELQARAAQYQDVLRQDLEARGFEVTTFWLGNTMLVKQATPLLISELRARKSVLSLEAEKIVARIQDPMVHEVYDSLPQAIAAGASSSQERALEWNIQIIRANWAWNYTRGERVTLSNIDTGVRYTHQALVRAYRGNLGLGRFDHDYNWWDPQRTSTAPFDNNGHGTHTMGTIIGDDNVAGIGVAPEAKWIAAKGCASSSCSNADLISSFQYLFAPTRQDGTGADVTRAPQVISNSWGGGQGSTAFLPYIQPHVEAGTVVAFSQGNSGSGCNTANSPGDLSVVIGIGSTNSLDQLSSFSSRGPGVNRPDFSTQKPDISAPGERVLSSYYLSDTSYATLSGTSMACPHIAGVIGLMFSVNPEISVDSVRELINLTADRNLGVPVGGLTTCGGVAYNSYPNYHYGFGRVNAERVVQNSLVRKN